MSPDSIYGSHVGNTGINENREQLGIKPAEARENEVKDVQQIDQSKHPLSYPYDSHHLGAKSAVGGALDISEKNQNKVDKVLAAVPCLQVDHKETADYGKRENHPAQEIQTAFLKKEISYEKFATESKKQAESEKKEANLKSRYEQLVEYKAQELKEISQKSGSKEYLAKYGEEYDKAINKAIEYAGKIGQAIDSHIDKVEELKKVEEQKETKSEIQADIQNLKNKKVEAEKLKQKAELENKEAISIANNEAKLKVENGKGELVNKYEPSNYKGLRAAAAAAADKSIDAREVLQNKNAAKLKSILADEICEKIEAILEKKLEQLNNIETKEENSQNETNNIKEETTSLNNTLNKSINNSEDYGY